MDESGGWGSKSARLYEEIRLSLQSGRYAPGVRLDATALAKQFRSSTTPVRHALYRLVGDGLVDDRARDGFFVPLISELLLRDLYDWMQRFLTVACDGVVLSRIKSGPLPNIKRGEDIAAKTRELFDDIAAAAGSPLLRRSVQNINQRLESVRRIEVQLLDDALMELIHLQRLWRGQDMAALAASMSDYHERRRQLVPLIIGILGDTSGDPR